MSQTTTDRPAGKRPAHAAGQGGRLGRRAATRRPGSSASTLNKVFPDHWSFMLGEIALYSFIILLLTGTYLTFFFDPSMAEVVYNGSYVAAARRRRCRGRTRRR